ncbi:MAG: DUF2079 domain-containing protein [Myxococcales bacterium]|nr:DUF2079 domain-containing protein [Myxococcales bacterium]
MRSRFEPGGAVAVGLLSLVFFIVGAVLLWAKWRNQADGLLDFAKMARNYEMLLQGFPYQYRALYYGYFYAGFLVLILPLYALCRSVTTIFAVHLLAFTAAVPLLYLLARRRLPGVALPLAIAAMYVLSPTVDLLTIGVLRFEAMWSLVYLLTVYCLWTGRWRAALWLTTLGCFLRLDGMPAFFILGLLWRRENRVIGRSMIRRSIFVAVLMIAAMVVFRLVSGIAPELGQSHLGDDGLSGLLKSLGSAAGYRHGLLLLQLLLLPLLAPRWLWPAAASALYILASAGTFYKLPLVHTLLVTDSWYTPALHTHDTILLPVLFVAAIEGLRNGLAWLERRRGARRWDAPALAGILAVLALAGHWFGTPTNLGPVPLTPAFNLDYYRQTPHSRAAWQALALAPRDRPGLMQFNFAERAWDYPLIEEIYPNTVVWDKYEYALIDLYAYSVNMEKDELLMKVDELLARGDFQVERFADGIVFFRRGQPDAKNEELRAFLAADRERLRQNLPSPYRDGPRERQRALDLTFSAAMLP